jgi:hypothetical protein
MLDKHKEKKKAAGVEDGQHRLNHPVRPHIMQEKEPDALKPLLDEEGSDKDEIIGLPEEWIVGEESPHEIQQEKPADLPVVSRPKILSAVKGAMKSAHLPKPDFPKPVRRPKILPDPAPAEQPVKTEIRNPAPPVIITETPVGAEPDDTLGEIPPFCKNCGKKVPPAANFCPACGIPLAPLQPARNRPPERKTIPAEPPVVRKKGIYRR